MINVLKNIPYQNNSMGKRKILDEKHILVMQIALNKGQSVPEHFANSNVHILVLEGKINLILNGKSEKYTNGDLIPISYKTKMQILNIENSQSTFLVIKTPNPTEL